MQIINFRNKPVIVQLAQIFLMLNIFSVGLIFIALTGDFFYQGVKESFAKKNISTLILQLQSDSTPSYSKTINLPDQKIEVTTSNIAEAEIKLPYFLSLFIPISFFTFFDLSWINLLFLLIFYILLLKIFNRLSVNEPFNEQTLRQIRSVSILLMIWGIVLLIRNGFLDYYFRDLSNNQIGFYTKFDSPSSLIQTGIIVFIIAYVYKRGLAYQQDSNLTV